MSEVNPPPTPFDELVDRYALVATGEIIAIPVPGADMAAVFVTWAKLVQEVAKLHGREVSMRDAKQLAWDFLRNALSAGGAWFGSAAVAQTILKAIPFGGTLTAYLLDATIAGAAVGKLTRSLANAANEHFARAALPEPEQKPKRRLSADELLGQIVSAGSSLASIIRGIKPG